MLDGGGGEAADGAEAFAELYRKYRSPLVWHVRSQGATEAEAHDAVQEAFAAALRAGGIHDQRAWFAWLRTVSVRSFLRARRASYGSGQVSVETVAPSDLPEPAPSSRFPVDESVGARLHEEDVMRLLRGLPARQREVFCMHLDGFTTPEIADRLGIHQTAVRQNLSRARRLLQSWIGEGVLSEP